MHSSNGGEPVDTLVMIDLVEADEAEKTLKVLVEGQLRLTGMHTDCLVAACSPGTVAERFIEMTREVDERAKIALSAETSVRRGILTCAYTAVRNLQFKIPKRPVYELGALIFVFRNREKIIRRLLIPDLQDDTPTDVVALLRTQIVHAQQNLPQAHAEPHEDAVSGKIADAVLAAFRDYALLMAGKNG